MNTHLQADKETDKEKRQMSHAAIEVDGITRIYASRFSLYQNSTVSGDYAELLNHDQYEIVPKGNS